MKNVKTLKFTASWCKPCQVLATQLEGEEMTTYDIDDASSRDALKKYQVRNVPTLIFIEEDEKGNTTELHRHRGVIGKEDYRKLVDALANEKVNPEYQEVVERIGSPQVKE